MSAVSAPAMAVEPLAVLIRKHPSIIGFRRGPFEDKISLYTDDPLLYLGDTGESLHTVTRLISDFGAISGFTINWSKSALMLLDPLTALLPDRASQIAIVDSFKYLGGSSIQGPNRITVTETSSPIG